MRKDTAAQDSCGIWVEILQRPGWEVRLKRGAEETKKAHAKINSHKTDDHMQTTEGPEKPPKTICQGDCSQPIEVLLNDGTLALSQVNNDETLVSVLKIANQVRA